VRARVLPRRGLDPEDGGIERLRRVARHELVPAEGARLVDDLGADVLARLPDADERAARVDEAGHAAGLQHVHRLDDELAAGRDRLRGDLVGVVDREVRAPGDRLFGSHQGPDARDALAVQGEDLIAAAVLGRLGRAAAVPSVQRAVEGRRGLDVR
jgi:hypothetical protein